MTGYLFSLVTFAAIVWIANGVRKIGAVSHGVPIGKRPGTALLLIDLQSVFWEQGPYNEAAKGDAKTAILNEVATAKADGLPIIAVRQEWSIPSTKLIARLMMKAQAIRGTSGTEVAAPFHGLADHVLVKRVQDAFETGELEELLKRLDVGKLRIAGLDLNYCVARTALAARRREYMVEIVTRATLCADQNARDRTFAALSSEEVMLR